MRSSVATPEPKRASVNERMVNPRILVAEDEYGVAFDLCDTSVEAGFEVEQPHRDISSAMLACQKESSIPAGIPGRKWQNITPMRSFQGKRCLPAAMIAAVHKALSIALDGQAHPA